MKALKNTAQLLSDARRLEEASRLTEAAALYQQLVDADPTDQRALPRLLKIYRGLKEPKKELAVIESALAAYAQGDKAIQENWISTHPQAAKAGRAFLKSLGGSNVSAFGSNPIVGRLKKRKEVVEKKLYGKGKSPKKAAKATLPAKRPVAAKAATAKAATAKAVAAKAVAAAATAKVKRAEARKQAAEQKRQLAETRKREAQQKRIEATADRKAAAAAKAAAAKAATAPPSLFVISLRYLAPLEKIDALLPKHNAFLDKYSSRGDFLSAGTQVPRTGDIIIAHGKNRAAVESLMRQDPFLKNKLAVLDLVEFTPYSAAPGLVR